MIISKIQNFISKRKKRKALRQKADSFVRLLEIMDELREKCPWDSVQTNETLRSLTIEETHELADAIMNNNPTEISKELGDVLLHIVFYAKIGSEQNQFDIKTVIDKLIEKLIYRHPHIFADTKVKNSDEVSQNWEQLKLKEKGGNKTVLEGVPTSLPAMIKANRIQEKARNVGFDWENKADVWPKVQEELTELVTEINAGNQVEMEKEMGDLLFSIINAGRLYDIDPETALELTNRKFIYRFNYIEQKAKEQNRSLKEMTLAEMDILWNQAKQAEKQ